MEHKRKTTEKKPSPSSVRPKVPDKPKTLVPRKFETNKTKTAITPKEVTQSCNRDGSSLVKVYDTAGVDDADDYDEFGFFSKGSPDTVTVTIKFSSAEKGIVTETKTSDKPVVRPKDVKYRKKTVKPSLLVDNISTDDTDSERRSHRPARPRPVPPPRNKRQPKAETLEVEDMLGVELGNVADTWENTSIGSQCAPFSVQEHSPVSIGPLIEETKETSHVYRTESTQGGNRTNITKPIPLPTKRRSYPRTKTTIVYDRSTQSPVTGTAIEIDRSGISDQDEGEDFVQYLKGLKAEVSSSSSDSGNSDEYVLYARRRSDIGGSGENGFHLDDATNITSLNDKRDMADSFDKLNKKDAELYMLPTEIVHENDNVMVNSALDDSARELVRHVSVQADNKTEDTDDAYRLETNQKIDKNDKNSDSESESEEDDDDDENDDDDDDDKEDEGGNKDDKNDDPPSDSQHDNDRDRDGGQREDSSSSSSDTETDDKFVPFSPGLRSRCYIASETVDIDESDISSNSSTDLNSSTELAKLSDKSTSMNICKTILNEVLENCFNFTIQADTEHIYQNSETVEEHDVFSSDPNCNLYVSDAAVKSGAMAYSEDNDNINMCVDILTDSEPTHCSDLENSSSIESTYAECGVFQESVGNIVMDKLNSEIASTDESDYDTDLQISCILSQEVESESDFESASESYVWARNIEQSSTTDTDVWSVSVDSVLDEAIPDVEPDDSSDIESIFDDALQDTNFDFELSEKVDVNDLNNPEKTSTKEGVEDTIQTKNIDLEEYFDDEYVGPDINKRCVKEPPCLAENIAPLCTVEINEPMILHNDGALVKQTSSDNKQLRKCKGCTTIDEGLSRVSDCSVETIPTTDADQTDVVIFTKTETCLSNILSSNGEKKLSDSVSSENTNNESDVKSKETDFPNEDDKDSILNGSLNAELEQFNAVLEAMEHKDDFKTKTYHHEPAAYNQCLSETHCSNSMILLTGSKENMLATQQGNCLGTNNGCSNVQDNTRDENNSKSNSKPDGKVHLILNRRENGQREVDDMFKTKTIGIKQDYRDVDVKPSEPPKYRTLTYSIPYIKPQNINKPSLEESRRQMLLCKNKQSLLDGRKIMKNIRNESTRHARILKRTQPIIESCENLTQLNEEPTVKTLQVGNGYIILGAGDLFNIPKDREKKSSLIGAGHCQGLPCRYFRGIPGVLNNAYKMSSMFPKAPPPTSAPPHHILHACNRLVTPVPVTTPPSPTKDDNYGMMLEATSSNDENYKSTDDLDLEEILHSARDCLNCSRFDDAEAAFLKLYQQIQEMPEDNGKLLVETLTGLADICIRRSRMCRSNPLEWQWLCMHAIALLQYTVEFCESELEDEHDNQLADWLQEQKQASELKCRPLEDAFVRALYNCLKHNANFFDPFQSFSLPNTPVHSNRKTSLFPLSSNMPQYLVIPGMRYRVTDQGLQKQSSDDTSVAVDWLAKFQHYCKDRLQTKDSKECTEKILKSNDSKKDDDTESVISQGSNDSLDWDNGDLEGIDEVNEDILEEDSPVKDYSLALELAACETENEGWDFFLDKRHNCNFQTVVQLSDSTVDRKDKEEEIAETTTKETKDIQQREKRAVLVLKDMISPLHEHSISLTLSRSFCRLADKLVQEEEYRKAEAVYDKILDIIETIQDGTAGMLKFSARIMKNLGTVKSKLGKASSGLALLNKALQTYRDLQDQEANFEIAVALIELGNGYIVGKNHEDSVFDDVIIAICDFFEKDSGDTQSTSTSSVGSTMTSSYSLRSENEERNVEEAIMCYTEAISLLDRYASDERQVDMFAKSIMRLGDCFFMQNDYDRALDCYEKALDMFRSSNIFGKDSLMENAHVLCMLGVSSFMLHVYPRAASVFEMALHMVKCAYGFRRTFLNGMLQSLSGITYYKMKNYHKCVSMCYQSFETYCDIFGEEMSRLNKQKFWLVCQTLYVMGNSYNILSLYQKSIKYLSIARSLMKSSKSRERRQFMRVLQILGDSYFAQYDYKTALTFYNEALEYGECESTISFDEVFDPNCASDEMAIHNRLVSKSAEAHLNMQQYQNAVHYLEQAHDIQEVMGEDIKEDLINTLNQLGEMHSLSGDIDKAIESYRESLEVFREIHHGELGPEMCTTLGNLAAICYVKACMSDDLGEEIEMIEVSEQYFKEALQLDTDDGICVKYANFLYSQGQYDEAIRDLNEALKFEMQMQMSDIVYTGLEKITLPDLLQDEVDTQEEICLPSACLARYILILCHKALGQSYEAETNLIALMEDVTDYDIPLLHSLLGYALMELSLFEEAAMSFYKAFATEEDYILASENYCICALIMLLKTVQNAVLNIWEYYLPKQKRCLK